MKKYLFLILAHCPVILPAWESPGEFITHLTQYDFDDIILSVDKNSHLTNGNQLVDLLEGKKIEAFLKAICQNSLLVTYTIEHPAFNEGEIFHGDALSVLMNYLVGVILNSMDIPELFQAYKKTKQNQSLINEIEGSELFFSFYKRILIYQKIHAKIRYHACVRMHFSNLKKCLGEKHFLQFIKRITKNMPRHKLIEFLESQTGNRSLIELEKTKNIASFERSIKRFFNRRPVEN